MNDEIIVRGPIIGISPELLADLCGFDLQGRVRFLLTHTADEVQIDDLSHGQYTIRQLKHGDWRFNPAHIAEGGTDDEDAWDVVGWKAILA